LAKKNFIQRVFHSFTISQAPTGDLRDGAPRRDQQRAAAALAGAAGGQEVGTRRRDEKKGEEWMSSWENAGKMMGK